MTMVLTAAQTTTFFENNAQMGIPHDTIIQLNVEGISVIADLADFDKDSIEQLASNLHHPGGTVPDPKPAAAPGAMVPTPPFVFGVKSQKQLTIACDLICYYNTVGCDYTPANMQWTHTMKNFEIQWKALEDQKDGKTLEVPKISKQLLIIKWTESFKDFLSRMIGVCMIPLAYII